MPLNRLSWLSSIFCSAHASYLDQKMSSVLQEGVVPDGQDDVELPLPSKDHANAPANVQDLISGP